MAPSLTGYVRTDPASGALPAPAVLVVPVGRYRGHEKVQGEETVMTGVHVRIGIYRESYHTDTACPALNGKPETFEGIKPMSREAAEVEGLKPCRRCKAE